MSFRELPPAIVAIKQLKVQPDVFLFDAQGLEHPHRCGFASYLGLAMEKPTIGAAKSRQIGELTERDGRIVLLDKVSNRRSRYYRGRPTRVYVSAGHMVSLETAVEIVRHCSKGKNPRSRRSFKPTT